MVSELCDNQQIGLLCSHNATKETSKRGIPTMNKTEIIHRFKKALTTSDIYLCYQPQFNHVTGRMVGAEALMRWHDSLYGDQYPSDFIPVLEESGLIHDADLHVFKLICVFIRKCLDTDIPIIPISFNISRYDIYNHDYVEEIESIRRHYEIPVKLLRAEITESSAIGGIELITKVLDKLHQYGYIVEMDDFGNGYSSLNILKDLPVDIIKLDMRFLSGQVESRGGLILNSVVQLSKWLNTPLIAEGVETNIQADFMKSLGCNYMQGYLYSRPLKEEDFIELLKQTTVDIIDNVKRINSQVDIYKFFDPNSMETEFFNTYVGPAAICLYDEKDINVIYANDKYYAELTITAHTTDSILDIYKEENHKLFNEAIKKAIKSQKEEICDTWIKVINTTCGESEICIRNYISVLSKFDNKYILYINVRNVTEEKELLQKVEESESKFRYASEHTNTYAWEYDIETKCMYPCSRCMRDLNIPPVVENYPEPLIGNLFPEDYAEMYRNWMKRLEKGEKHLEAIIPLTEDRIPFRVEYTNIFDEAGRPYKAYGSATPENIPALSNQITSEIAAAMAGFHIAVYEIDLETDEFIVFYSSHNNKEIIGNVGNGTNFFQFMQEKTVKRIVEEDKERFKKEINKDYVLNELNKNGIFRHVYKFNEKNHYIKYTQAKIVFVGKSKKHLLIVIDDITSAIEDKNAYMEIKENNKVYAHITKALSKDYIKLYYVNIETDEYIEYMQGVGVVNIVRKGDNFSEAIKETISKIHPDDKEVFEHDFDRNKIIKTLKKGHTYTINYRIYSEATKDYIYVGLKISSLDGQYAIIGISDITRQMKSSETIKKMEEDNMAYSRVFALAGDYICIYIVESDNTYDEYSASDDYLKYKLPSHGTNFFEEAAKNTKLHAYEKDVSKVLRMLNREHIENEIEKNGFVQIEYRLNIGDQTKYVNLKAVSVEDSKGKHLVLGLNDIDKYVRNKQKYEMKLMEATTRANVDPLTGVKNKHAYIDMEESINRQIEEGTPVDFGIAVFDVNELKQINDNGGYQAGDEYLKEACSIICTIFQHSPVFRIGGDEFVAILRGNDYNNSNELFNYLQNHNERNKMTDIATIACGIAKYRSDDNYVSDVFARANEAMYKNKEKYKKWIKLTGKS